jgi:uncharacterized protein YjbI with pentapeptide repeats
VPLLERDGSCLEGAYLEGACLEGAQIIQSDFCDATLTGSNVYGVSVWDIKVNDRTKQQNLIITDRGSLLSPSTTLRSLNSSTCSLTIKSFAT